MTSLFIVVGTLMTAVVNNRPVELEDRRPVGNYWNHLQEIIKSFPPNQDLRSPLIIEKIRHLRAKDCLRAAQQGAAESRMQTTADPAKGLEAGIARSALSMEWYSILAEEETDFNLLLPEVSNKDGEPAVRIYLMQAMSDWTESASNFSKYCTDNLRLHFTDLSGTARSIAADNSVLPEVGSAAVEMGFRWLEAQYICLLQTDPRWKTWIESENIIPAPSAFRSPALPPGSAASVAKLETLSASLRDFILLCERRSRTSALPLRDTCAKILVVLKKDFPEPAPTVPVASPAQANGANSAAPANPSTSK